jgi:transcriptional regulator with XRE-family HTH domain
VIDTTSPSERTRELGTQLRELRNQRGHTVEDVAEDFLWSTTKVSRIEIGARCPSLLDVRDLCVRYGIDWLARAKLMALARDARERGWWTEYGDLNLIRSQAQAVLQ